MLRVHVRGGSLWLPTPGYGTEERLHPLPDGSFAIDDPSSPERIVFDEPIDGVPHRVTWAGWSSYRSSMD